MTSVGLRELGQNPSEVVARVERGETIVITVQGRPAAQLVPLTVPRRRWVASADLERALADIEPDSTGWAAEAHAARDGDSLTDPWQGAAE